MYKIIDRNLTLDDVTVKEGQRGMFFSLEEIRDVDCAANCKEIVIAYFQMFH
jgi:DNA-binding cell septation regulator SpoVG